MKARELMTENPRVCGPGDTAQAALAIMRDEDCGVVPITEGNGQLRVVGVVTDRDIALYLGQKDERPSEVRLANVMTPRAISVEPNADVDDVERRMQEGQVRRILVCENGRLLVRTHELEGAFRPVPSPDGKWLVYSTRYDAREALKLIDLTTGADSWLKMDVLSRVRRHFPGHRVVHVEADARAVQRA